eukprot:365006-Chlamydomonas_euryale.AAC.1
MRRCIGRAAAVIGRALHRRRARDVRERHAVNARDAEAVGRRTRGAVPSSHARAQRLRELQRVRVSRGQRAGCGRGALSAPVAAVASVLWVVQHARDDTAEVTVAADAAALEWVEALPRALQPPPAVDQDPRVLQQRRRARPHCGVLRPCRGATTACMVDACTSVRGRMAVRRASSACAVGMRGGCMHAPVCVVARRCGHAARAVGGRLAGWLDSGSVAGSLACRFAGWLAGWLAARLSS